MPNPFYANTHTAIWVEKGVREKLFSMKDFSKPSVNAVIKELITFHDSNNKGKKKYDFRKKI